LHKGLFYGLICENFSGLSQNSLFTGFTTAYIGSSNIPNPALTSGLGWNRKITAEDTGKLRIVLEQHAHGYGQTGIEDGSGPGRNAQTEGIANTQMR
jgi:hypothetical protein